MYSAARLFAACQTWEAQSQRSSPSWWGVGQRHERDLSVVQAHLGEPEAAAGWAAGQNTTLEEATTYGIEGIWPRRRRRYCSIDSSGSVALGFFCERWLWPTSVGRTPNLASDHFDRLGRQYGTNEIRPDAETEQLRTVFVLRSGPSGSRSVCACSSSTRSYVEFVSVLPGNPSLPRAAAPKH
jgi:hypothetical protein